MVTTSATAAMATVLVSYRAIIGILRPCASGAYGTAAMRPQGSAKNTHSGTAPGSGCGFQLLVQGEPFRLELRQFPCNVGLVHDELLERVLLRFAVHRRVCEPGVYRGFPRVQLRHLLIEPLEAQFERLARRGHALALRGFPALLVAPVHRRLRHGGDLRPAPPGVRQGAGFRRFLLLPRRWSGHASSGIPPRPPR